MNCCLQRLNRWTRSVFKVSVIMQVAKWIGTCQTEAIDPIHIGIQPLGLFCNKQSSLAGLIMRAVVPLQDTFPHKRNPNFVCQAFKFLLPIEDNRSIRRAIKCCSTSARLHSWERQPIRAGLLPQRRRCGRKQERCSKRIKRKRLNLGSFDTYARLWMNLWKFNLTIYETLSSWH